MLDAARTALIPLRPLTIGEILDGGFLIVRRNIRLMIGLPLVVAGGTAAYVLAGVGLWVLLGNTTARSAQIVLTVLMGLLGLLRAAAVPGLDDRDPVPGQPADRARRGLRAGDDQGHLAGLAAVVLAGARPVAAAVAWRSASCRRSLSILYYVVAIGVVLAGVAGRAAGRSSA